MEYVILTLAAILIGISVGALFSNANKALKTGSVLGIALGIATLVTASWQLLAVGAAIYIVAQITQRDASAHA